MFPLTDAAAGFVTASRATVRAILRGQDPRLMVVVGPCSIHDPDAAVEYATRLAEVRKRLADSRRSGEEALAWGWTGPCCPATRC